MVGARPPLWRQDRKAAGCFGIGKGERPYYTRFSAVAAIGGSRPWYDPTAPNGWSSTTRTAESDCPTASCQSITAFKPWALRDGDGAPSGPAPEQGRDRARPPASVSPALRPLLTGARSRIWLISRAGHDQCLDSIGEGAWQ
jgi:hypothetical protein